MIKRKTFVEKEDKPKIKRQRKQKVPDFDSLKDLIVIDESGNKVISVSEKNVRVAFERPVYKSVEIHVGIIHEVDLKTGTLTLIDESKGDQFYGITFMSYPHRIKLL